MLGWALAAACLLSPVLAADWPQLRGPQRNGISTEKGWIARWAGAGPRQAWAAQVGLGWSSMAVVGGRLYTMGNIANKDSVYCLNAVTGRPIWKQTYACRAGDYSGTRATPTVLGGRVYTLSREGHAYCFDTATGKIIWNSHLMQDARAVPPRWGFAGSPLVDGNRVIYNAGSAGVALDKNTGKVLWKSGAVGAGYASPVAYTVKGRHGVAVFSAAGLFGLDSASGRQQWFFPWKTQYGVNAADPIFTEGNVFISSDYNAGGALVRLDGGEPKVIWRNRNMRNKGNSSVLLNGALYGNDQGSLKCVELRTGAEKWRQPGVGMGGLIAADGKLIVVTERGALLIVQATPARYTQLARAQLPRGSYFTQPVLANGRIYCRSHEGSLVCLDVRAKR